MSGEERQTYSAGKLCVVWPIQTTTTMIYCESMENSFRIEEVMNVVRLAN